MKLGVSYNVWDGEELLEYSIRSIRSSVDYIIVVYQRISNFGVPCDPNLEKLLHDLVERKLVDELFLYVPQQTFTTKEKRALVSPYADTSYGATANVSQIADQFFNELCKREIGRAKCEERGCTHYMTMDADEFYLRDQFENAKRIIEENDYEGSACRMRYFFKKPTYEMLPRDELNHVPFIVKLGRGAKFQLAHPYPCLVDPTRTMNKVRRFKIFERNELEMYHMSFVRKDMRKKLYNVSNRANYVDVEEFLREFDTWEIGATASEEANSNNNQHQHHRIIHPHPYFKELFKEVRVVPNYFGIPISFSNNYNNNNNNMKTSATTTINNIQNNK